MAPSDTRAFVPDDFDVPQQLIHTAFRLEPLGVQHNERDYAAWTTSMDHIKATPGFVGRKMAARNEPRRQSRRSRQTRRRLRRAARLHLHGARCSERRDRMRLHLSRPHGGIRRARFILGARRSSRARSRAVPGRYGMARESVAVRVRRLRSSTCRLTLQPSTAVVTLGQRLRRIVGAMFYKRFVVLRMQRSRNSAKHRESDQTLR